MITPLNLIDITIGLSGHADALIHRLSLTVQPGEVATVMGPSGSGKSTLLSFVSGHLPANFRATGRVEAGGRDVTSLPAERRRVGILFQDDLLFPHLSVGDNLAFGLAPSVTGAHRRRATIDDALESAGLAGFAGRDPASLSGGQRARVALLRSLLAEPAALLLDEPFSRLDASLRDEFRAYVFDTVRSRGLPVLMVTHDADDAAAARGPVVRIDQHGG